MTKLNAQKLKSNVIIFNLSLYTFCVRRQKNACPEFIEVLALSGVEGYTEIKRKVSMFKTLAKIFLCLFIILGFFAAVFSTAKTIKPPLASAVSCSLRITPAPYSVGGQIDIVVENANTNTNYRVYVIKVGVGAPVYIETRNTGLANFAIFPPFTPGSGGDYQFAAYDPNFSACTNSGLQINVGGQMSDDCVLEISPSPYNVGSVISISMRSATVGNGYMVTIIKVGGSLLYDERRAASSSVVTFPSFTIPSIGEYQFATSNVLTGFPCKNTVNGKTISAGVSQSVPYFVTPAPGTKYNWGFATLTLVRVANVKAGEKYRFGMEGEWSGEIYISAGFRDYVFTADSRGRISITNICDNGQADRDFRWPCEDKFKEGHYVIKLRKHLDNTILAETSFDVVTDGSGEGQYIPVSGENPCNKDLDGDGIIDCETAIGNISTQIGPFAQKILEIGVGLAGGIALIIMVIGSIRVLTSAGDPKNVSAGREMIIAAVAGLLFLIFSVLILRWIGVFIVY